MRKTFSIREAVPSIRRFFLMMATLLMAATGLQAASVILYCSQDQVFAEPLLKVFENESGIEVKAVYDSEALKTASLANRLRAEKSNPRCDVFWSNEEMLARTLVDEGITRLHSKVGPAGFRRRVMVASSALPANAEPYFYQQLTNAIYSGHIAMAYPLYGTTAHCMAQLRQMWGDARWEAWCDGLRANRIKVVDGNSTVVRLAASGQIWLGLTDSDDVHAGLAEGWKIRSIIPGHESLAIYNTVSILKDAPHPVEASALADFLCSKKASDHLIKAGALSPVVSPSGEPLVEGGTSDWPAMLKAWPDTRQRMEKGFAR